MDETPYVELVRQTMVELVGGADISQTDNLFSVGGDSLAAIRLAWRLSQTTGLDVNVADDIMADPTPLAIARRLADRLAEPSVK